MSKKKLKYTGKNNFQRINFPLFRPGDRRELPKYQADVLLKNHPDRFQEVNPPKPRQSKQKEKGEDK